MRQEPAPNRQTGWTICLTSLKEGFPTSRQHFYCVFFLRGRTATFMVCFSTDWADQFQFSLLLLRVSKCLFFLFSSGPWKRACLVKYGIVTQCLSPQKINDQYLTNVLLKINAKVFHTAIIDTVTIYGFLWLCLSYLTITMDSLNPCLSLCC